MFYIIKNISPNKNDIAIGKDNLKPGCTMRINEIESLKTLIDVKYIEVIYPKESKPLDVIVKAPEVKEKDFIEDEVKQKLIESFFNFYLVKDVSKENLDILKWFYKNIGFTSNISKNSLDLLDAVNNQEELTEILLNVIYPELLDQYSKNKK
jgi:hypothetical protein